MDGKADTWDRARATLVEDDACYCRRRAAEERAVAMDSHHPRVRQVHLDMADRYEDLARAIQTFGRHLEHKLEVVP